MSATATAPQTPPIIEKLEAERQQATTARREAESQERDGIRPDIEAYNKTGKTSPALENYILKHSMTKQGWTFTVESHSSSEQHDDFCCQIKTIADEVAELSEDRRTVSKKLKEAEAAFNKLDANFILQCTDEDRFEEYDKAKNLVSSLALRERYLNNRIKEAEAEIASLKRAADEIVVLIDPTSKLAPPMNFAIAGGPKQSIKSPFQKAESIKLREDKLAKAKREIEERETKIANYRARFTELTAELATAQATFGDDRADEINKIKARIEFCEQQIREKSDELDKWRMVEAEETRRLELEKLA